LNLIIKIPPFIIKHASGLLFGFLEALLSGRADEEVLLIDCQSFALNI
jgi:hypothetical protein